MQQKGKTKANTQGKRNSFFFARQNLDSCKKMWNFTDAHWKRKEIFYQSLKAFFVLIFCERNSPTKECYFRYCGKRMQQSSRIAPWNTSKSKINRWKSSNCNSTKALEGVALFWLSQSSAICCSFAFHLHQSEDRWFTQPHFQLPCILTLSDAQSGKRETSNIPWVEDILKLSVLRECYIECYEYMWEIICTRQQSGIHIKIKFICWWHENRGLQRWGADDIYGNGTQKNVGYIVDREFGSIWTRRTWIHS